MHLIKQRLAGRRIPTLPAFMSAIYWPARVTGVKVVEHVTSPTATLSTPKKKKKDPQ